jgi:hypothetical protein
MALVSMFLFKIYLRNLCFSILLTVIILIFATISFWQFTGSETFDFSTFTPIPLNFSSLIPFDAPFDYNVRLDAHSHTTMSDGSLTPEQLVHWGIAGGFNAMIITDHNSVEGGLAAQLYVKEANLSSQIVIFPGMEYTSCRIHMNLLNINQTIPLCREGNHCPFPTDDDIRSVIERTHALGGLVSVNHLPWSLTRQKGRNIPRLENHPSLEELKAWGIDSVEGVNQNILDLPTIQFAKENNLTILTGSDTQDPVYPAAWTLLQVNDTSDPVEIWDAIRARRTSFIVNPIDPDGDTISQIQGRRTASFSFGEVDQGTFSFQGPFCQQPKVEIFYGSIVSFLFMYLVVSLIVFGCCQLRRRRVFYLIYSNLTTLLLPFF